MRWVKYILSSFAMALLVIAGVDHSLRAMIAALALTAAAYAIHRKFITFWWFGCALLIWSFAQSVYDAFRGPGTHMAIMSSVIGMLLAALLFSVWIRQRHYFVTREGCPDLTNRQR